MKKVVAILVVLTMALGFSITALADDFTVQPPVEVGEWSSVTQTPANIDLELENPPEDLESEAYGWHNWGDVEAEWQESHLEWVSDVISEYMDSDAYDSTISFNAARYIAGVEMWERNPDFDWDTYNSLNELFDELWDEFDKTGLEPYSEQWWDAFDLLWTDVFEDFWDTNDEWMSRDPGLGGWITIKNNDWGGNVIKAILQWFSGEGDDGEWINEFRLIAEADFEFDADGNLRIRVADFGSYSLFFALLQQLGVVANERSPRTADNSINVGIILIIVLLAATATTVIYKKARNHD